MSLKNKILIIVCTLLFSCSAVKKVLKDKEKFEVVGREWEKVNPCIVDSVVNLISDTIINYDTSYIYKFDTIDKLDVVEIFDTVYITKTVRIKDSTKVNKIDLRRLNIALDSANHYKKLSDFYKNQFDKQVFETKLQKQRGNKWALNFWLLLIIPLLLLIIYIFLRRKFKFFNK
jgi:preprotein translocase subunit SecF